MDKKYWRGFVSGTNRGMVQVRLRISDSSVEGELLFHDGMGASICAHLTGVREDGEYRIEGTDVLGHHARLINPTKITIRMRPEQEGDEDTLVGSWVTNVGTQGDVRLVRASGLGQIFSYVPTFAIRLGVVFLNWLRSSWRWLYLVAFLIYAFLSIHPGSGVHLGATEAVALGVPLVLSFAEKIRAFFRVTGIRRFGPVEVAQQAEAPAALVGDDVQAAVQQRLIALQQKYQGMYALFMSYTQFFVPATKQLLVRMASLGTAVSPYEFGQLAAEAGVLKDHVEVTLQALLNTRVVEVAKDGNLIVTAIGSQFLEFELEVSRLLRA